MAYFVNGLNLDLVARVEPRLEAGETRYDCRWYDCFDAAGDRVGKIARLDLPEEPPASIIPERHGHQFITFYGEEYCEEPILAWRISPRHGHPDPITVEGLYGDVSNSFCIKQPTGPDSYRYVFPGFASFDTVTKAIAYAAELNKKTAKKA